MKQSEKKHIAILAKNSAARMIKRHEDLHPLQKEYLLQCLKDIELVTGTGNQPSIESIIENDNI